MSSRPPEQESLAQGSLSHEASARPIDPATRTVAPGDAARSFAGRRGDESGDNAADDRQRLTDDGMEKFAAELPALQLALQVVERACRRASGVIDELVASLPAKPRAPGRPLGKASAEQIEKIVRLKTKNPGMGLRAIADRVGVGRHTVERVIDEYIPSQNLSVSSQKPSYVEQDAIP